MIGAYVTLALVCAALSLPLVAAERMARRKRRRRSMPVAVLRDEFWREQFARIEREQWERERNGMRGDA